MAITASEREAFFQGKILEKYGARYGITTELLNKIDRGTATEDELNTYIENADKLVMKFKEDLRTTEPEKYSNTDIEIVMAMIEANYLHFKHKNESYSKVIPETGVQNLLNMRYGAPAVFKFSALNRYSADLSPQQIISQFGLDYQYQQDGEVVTPYLAKDGENFKRQPFVFVLETPMNEDIQANAKLPVDPRIMERFEQMANDAQLPAQTRQQATDFLARNQDNICLIVRNTDDKERLEQKYQNKYKIISAQDAPYTGNTAPQYGNKLQGQSAYADVIQEMFVTKPSPVSPGAKIYAKFPKEGVDPEREDLPAGSEAVAIAEWDGTQWKVIASDRQLQSNFKRTLATYPDSVKQQWENKTFTNKQLEEWDEAGKQKTFLTNMQ